MLHGDRKGMRNWLDRAISSRYVYSAIVKLKFCPPKSTNAPS